MSTNVAASTENAPNPFQKHLIPSESRWVRYVMKKAGDYSRYDNFFTSRALSVACAIAGVVLSVFNIITYLLQAPIRVILNIVTFSPIKLTTDLVQDLVNGALSFAFVSLGVTFVIAGILFPEPIFTNFAPANEETLLGKLEQQEGELEEMKQTNEKLLRALNVMSEKVEELEGELKRARESRRWFSWAEGADSLSGCCSSECTQAERVRPHEHSERPKPFRKWYKYANVEPLSPQGERFSQSLT